MTPTPPSPCISICVMDEQSGFCKGCARTIDEIANWGLLDNAEKQAVWRDIFSRQATQNK